MEIPVMPNIKIVVKHSLPKEEAIGKIKSLLEEVRTDYADKISKLQEVWEGPQAIFSFEVLDGAADGSIKVTDDEVVVECGLPFRVTAFKSTIESTMEDKMKQLLAKKEPAAASIQIDIKLNGLVVSWDLMQDATHRYYVLRGPTGTPIGQLPGILELHLGNEDTSYDLEGVNVTGVNESKEQLYFGIMADGADGEPVGRGCRDITSLIPLIRQKQGEALEASRAESAREESEAKAVAEANQARGKAEAEAKAEALRLEFAANERLKFEAKALADAKTKVSAEAAKNAPSQKIVITPNAEGLPSWTPFAGATAQHVGVIALKNGEQTAQWVGGGYSAPNYKGSSYDPRPVVPNLLPDHKYFVQVDSNANDGSVLARGSMNVTALLSPQPKAQPKPPAPKPTILTSLQDLKSPTDAQGKKVEPAPPAQQTQPAKPVQQQPQGKLGNELIHLTRRDDLITWRPLNGITRQEVVILKGSKDEKSLLKYMELKKFSFPPGTTEFDLQQLSFPPITADERIIIVVSNWKDHDRLGWGEHGLTAYARENEHRSNPVVTQNATKAADQNLSKPETKSTAAPVKEALPKVEPIQQPPKAAQQTPPKIAVPTVKNMQLRLEGDDVVWDELPNAVNQKTELKHGKKNALKAAMQPVPNFTLDIETTSFSLEEVKTTSIEAGSRLIFHLTVLDAKDNVIGKGEIDVSSILAASSASSRQPPRAKAQGDAPNNTPKSVAKTKWQKMMPVAIIGSGSLVLLIIVTFAFIMIYRDNTKSQSIALNGSMIEMTSPSTGRIEAPTSSPTEPATHHTGAPRNNRGDWLVGFRPDEPPTELLTPHELAALRPIKVHRILPARGKILLNLPTGWFHTTPVVIANSLDHFRLGYNFGSTDSPQWKDVSEIMSLSKVAGPHNPRVCAYALESLCDYDIEVELDLRPR